MADVLSKPDLKTVSDLGTLLEGSATGYWETEVMNTSHPPKCT